MRSGTTFLTASGLLLLAACTTKTIILTPEPRRETPGPSTAATLGVPPGHLPAPGECRVWIPGVPPGRQPRPKSRPCAGIASVAPAGSWIIYRPTQDRKLVHVRVVDERRAGIVIRIQIFDIDSRRLVREEAPQDEPRQPDQPREERPQGERRPEYRPREERPQDPRPPDAKLREEPPSAGASTAATLGVPPGQLPEPGECRVWIPGAPPGQQRHRPSRDCAGITRDAPAGSWIVYRPTEDKKVVHVRVVDERRVGVVIRVQVFDIDTKRLVREERP